MNGIDKIFFIDKQRIMNVHRYIEEYADNTIFFFQKKRLDFLLSITFADFFDNQNPYLLYTQQTKTIAQIIHYWIDMEIYKNEETIFGDWLEGLAIFINEKVYDGRKSGIPNIDLEFDNKEVRYIVTIKSGPNWGNSSQISKMIADFKTAKKTLRTSNSQLNITAVNGCCYGIDNNPDKGDYFKYCGQKFWAFISGNENLYLEIIEPLGHKAKERNEEFQKSYTQMINKFTKEFSNTYCNDNGEIDWKKLVKFNSGKKE